MSAATETAKIEMEAARADVAEGEKEIQQVKAALRQLQGAASSRDSEEAPNTLEIAVLKVCKNAAILVLVDEHDCTIVDTHLCCAVSMQIFKVEGLPEGAEPSFALQLSSPVEEIVLDSLFDPLAPTENIATFSGVEASVATLTVSAKDADIELGVSSLHDVAPLCPMDAMSPQPEYVTELAVAIVAKDSTEDTGDAIVEPVCTVTLRVTYKPSAKDQREELYDLLNKASQKKAKAITQLRKSAMAVSRAGPSSTEVTTTKKKSPAVKAGFLNKKKSKEPSKLKAWYDKNLGPQSLLRASIIPFAKNYVIFFGTIAFCHWKGHELALPAPV